MLRDITIGQHFPGNSLVHRFDPRLKLVLTVAYIVLLFAASNPLGLTLSILFLGVMYKVAKIPVKMIGKSLKPILPIVLFTAVLNLFFVSGESELAGAAAANYIQNGPVATGRVLTVKPGADLGYTLPQRIRLEGVEKSTNVSFRVRRICGKSTILVKSGDTVIAHFKRDRLAPGEMEHIALPKVLLDRAPMDEVTIEIEEA